jgi:hypothetical protein
MDVCVKWWHKLNIDRSTKLGRYAQYKYKYNHAY